MKIETNEQGVIVLKEVFSGVLLETEEGNTLGVCMRDDTFEMTVTNKATGANTFLRPEMDQLEIQPLSIDVVEGTQPVCVWACKVVVKADKPFPKGFDSPPRRAVTEAIEEKGFAVLECFSGWSGKLNKNQKQIVKDHNGLITVVDSPKEVREGSTWRHTNGNVYQVLFLTNADNQNDKYPTSVVCRNINNDTKWSRYLSEWYRSMVEIV